jgi:hypothetical protein
MDILTRCPESIRNKIIIYYLGIGTPAKAILMPFMQEIKTVKKYSTACTDDFTLWRCKIAKHQDETMTVKSTTYSGYIALCELTIAYNISELCTASDYTKDRRIFTCEMAIASYGIIPHLI